MATTSPVHVTRNHTGKMIDMQSISTSCTGNGNCARYAKIEGSVCQKCYAMRMQKMYKTLQAALLKNNETLTEQVLPKDFLPTINVSYFRLEAFGDLINETQVKNYFNICNANPDTHFALWTKNPHLIAKAIEDGYEKPENLNIILSSLFLNDVADKSKWSFVDKVFTVYDKDHLDGVQINCGAKKCIECKLCYTKNNVEYINEKLK